MNKGVTQNMNKKLLLILPLLALCACNETTISNASTSLASSESSSSEESSSQNSSVEEKGWTEEQEQLMKEYLHDEVLPYIDVGRTKIQFDNASNKLYILGFNTVNQDILATYATKYSADNGWVDDSATSIDKTFVFQKQVQTEEGTRYVNVKFYAADTTTLEPADEGVFALIANDPYEYEFPTSMFDSYLKDQVGSELHVPEFKADYYTVNKTRYSVYCYTSDTKAETTYTQTLRDNNFTILSGRQDNVHIAAESSDQKFTIKYVYLSSGNMFEILVEKK